MSGEEPGNVSNSERGSDNATGTGEVVQKATW